MSRTDPSVPKTSRRRLPLLEPHRQAHTYCTFCPKLCRSACPVSNVEGRETSTPWGMMTLLHHVTRDDVPLADGRVDAWWACTGCMHCRTRCDHDNDVASGLRAGRAEAARTGSAPEAAYRVIERHASREARAAQAAEALFTSGVRPGARVAYVPGCTVTALSPGEARAGFEATRALVDSPLVVEQRQCCGLPLLEAGDQEGFLRSAERLLERLDGMEQVVFQDPGCLHALRRIVPELGHRPPRPGLEHLMELAARKLEGLAPRRLPDRVRWLDPCRLGRGLGVYEAPRRVLAHILTHPPEEMPARREEARCSGAGGQLPRTRPSTARAIADERLAEHGRSGGGALVTACPGAVRNLRRVPGAHVVDAATLLARAALHE